MAGHRRRGAAARRAFRAASKRAADFTRTIAAYVWRRGYFKVGSWRRSLAPVFAGIALLAYTGVGGENTDVVAHFTGFVAGICLGILAASFDVRRLGHSGQYIAGVICVGLVCYAWALAGSAG